MMIYKFRCFILFILLMILILLSVVLFMYIWLNLLCYEYESKVSMMLLNFLLIIWIIDDIYLLI